MRITSKGQVTIPQHIRERHGLLPETEVDFVERDGAVVIVPRRSERPDRGDKAVAALRGTGHRRMSTDELLRLTRD
jgi:AbrB family looped-hinge helix DNA binding protein